MGLIKTLKNEFLQSGFDPPKADWLKETLNEDLSPILRGIGLDKWNGSYQWFGDFNDQGIKKVFEYVGIKGARGTFVYGNCFSFVPTISNKKKLLNHKTDKSTSLHLFERTEGWRKSFEGGQLTDMISQWNKRTFKSDLKSLIKKYQPIILDWYSDNSNIENCIKTIHKQENGGYGYKLNYPNQTYILAFLKAKLGNIDEAKSIMDKYLVQRIKDMDYDESIYAQVMAKLDATKGSC